MFTVTFFQRASSNRPVGSGRSASRSNCSNSSRRDVGWPRKSRPFSQPTRSAIAAGEYLYIDVT
jgi:hypothetical protein